jgi:hypothetical protein
VLERGTRNENENENEHENEHEHEHENEHEHAGPSIEAGQYMFTSMQ